MIFVKNNNTIISVFMLGIMLVTLVACTEPGIVPGPSGTGKGVSGNDFDEKFDPNAQLETNSFKSVNEYQQFLKLSAGGNYGYYERSGMAGMALEADFAMNDVVAAPAIGGEALKIAANPTDFSTTNNQVKGVDEGDILKTDGNYIYTITDNTLYIIKAYPGEDAEVVSEITIKNQPRSLFIKDDKLAIFGDVRDSDFLQNAGVMVRNGMTFVDIYDVSDRSEPELIEEFKYEGRYYNSRMIGDDMYIITNLYPMKRIDYPLPVYFEGDTMVEMRVSDIHYFNIPYRNPNFVGINSINIENADNIETKVVAVEGSPNMYMSENNIYITYTEYINEYEIQQDIIKELIHPKLPEHYKDLIKKIEATDGDVLNKYEKDAKIMRIYTEFAEIMSTEEQEELGNTAEEMLIKKLEEFEYFQYTVINKVAVDNGEIDIEKNGQVPGGVINQFSMDEFEGNLRIGTTIDARWSRFGKERTESENNIYVLDEDLDIIGEIVGLAKGERIYSTRFMGDRLYMVTFRQVDPFFVIDLSNPRNPKELGELKIPGFSRYLHPYDENTIIGIGRDASETGRQEGLKISLFDVSDVQNPKEIAKYVSDDKYSRSTAEFEHKAFLFSKEKNLLVIPVVNNQNTYWENGIRTTQGDKYNGAFVFDIKKDEINIRGLIDHSKAGYNNYWQPAVERSLYIEDLLYTKSPYLLRINDLDDLKGVKDVELKPGNSGDIPVY